MSISSFLYESGRLENSETHSLNFMLLICFHHSVERSSIESLHLIFPIDGLNESSIVCAVSDGKSNKTLKSSHVGR